MLPCHNARAEAHRLLLLGAAASNLPPPRTSLPPAPVAGFKLLNGGARKAVLESCHRIQVEDHSGSDGDTVSSFTGLTGTACVLYLVECMAVRPLGYNWLFTCQEL